MIAIRPATLADAATIVALVQRLAEFERSPTPVALTEDIVRRDCFGSDPRLRVLLAEADGHVCGMVTLLDAYSSWSGAGTMIIHDLYVDTQVRGLGIGGKLLAAVAQMAAARGCCRLDVNVLSWNSAARSFYAKLGFSPLADWLPYRLSAQGIHQLAGTSAG
ncbi:MAG: GNAT family N-acetyltransferase [Magnetococcus sp. WYHC-3]